MFGIPISISGENKENIINLSSAEFAIRVVKVKLRIDLDSKRALCYLYHIRVFARSDQSLLCLLTESSAAVKYSRLSLSRPRLSRTDKKILWKRGEIVHKGAISLFSTIFSKYL